MTRARRRTPAADLTRRELLGTALAAGAFGAATAAAGGEPARPARGDYDVVVLGAGFCGVTAARECARAGLRTLVLEARERIGGRTYTTEWHGAVTELGGTWVHWSQPYVWAEIQRYGLPLVESIGATAPRIVVRRGDGDLAAVETRAQIDAVARALATYMGDSRALFPRPHAPFEGPPAAQDAVSAEAPLARIADPFARDFVDGFIATSAACLPRDAAWVEMVRWYALSGHDFADLNDAVARYRFRDGTRALLDAMLADAKPEPRLSTPAASVQQGAQGVRVRTTSGDELAARCVISALPLNVLRDVAWEPALDPRKLEASAQRHAGASTKLHAVIEGEQNVACLAAGASPLSWLFTDHVAKGTTHLIGFGPSPALLDVSSREQVEAAVKSLIPGAKLLDSTGWIWTDDPFARGTWCVLRPGQYGKYLAALQAPAGRVVFASADWANGWRGFIDGAIEQGIAAARSVRRLLA
jgi:monoamine oxidase